MKAGVWLCAWSLGAVVAGSVAAQTGPIVKTPAGALQGMADGAVVVFKNVPYAPPPVATLRWRTPQPPAPWTGVRPATEPGPACIQTSGGSGYHGGEPRRAAADYLTFSQVIEPDRRRARDEAKAGSPAWVYYFSYVPLSLRTSTMGAWHGAEVPYVFDTLNKTPVAARVQPLMPATFPAATPEDEAMARATHGAWVAFAKSGKPGWPAIGPHGDVTMVYGAGGALVDQSFDKASLDNLEEAAKTRAAR